ncbi:M23 family metallopeptidase [Salisediminibacterium selenitireducens]|uniref:Peptidase M23 n=1 Tax=Bacillus selenitireducens (strain ATCC 700615 / DSM 15326 / MLS10) TaxID=439292 RepID=D6Y1J8_BACIE|nr:M23 family metallopeptidase [Salisediminibacterium selenitireducens]ADI00785.1 Peptidase M23 [[Bacillus] selenitireducens MLS10]
MGQTFIFRKITISMAGLLFMALFIPGLVFSEDNNFGEFEMDEIYHVYYGDERLGAVQDEDLITSYIENKLAEAENNDERFTYRLSEEVELIPELVFELRGSDQDVLDLLEERASVQVDARGLMVNDETIGYVSADKKPDDIEREIFLRFVDEEDLEEYEEWIDRDEALTLSEGDSVLTELSFDEEVTWSEGLAEADEILEVDDLITVLLEGTLEQDIYEVDEGDVLGTIASDHDLSTEELIAINEGIGENTVLQIGQELHVTVPVPYLNVLVEKVTKSEQTMTHETVTEKDDEMWKGESTVRQSGSDGKKEVEEKVVYVNGQVQEREIISEEIIQEAEDRIVVHGTKTSSSRGTGDLIWPASGGYVSSQFGMRNGRMHNGIDIARPSSYEIYAADNGVVSSAGWENGYGYTVRINHNNGMETVYAHLRDIHVSTGQTVGKGRQIGVMGTTGRSSGIHLHFEVIQGGSHQNPMNYLR